MDNPIDGILRIMQFEGERNNPSPICLGIVDSLIPLQIKCNDLILSSRNLKVADFLLDQYKRTFSMEGIIETQTQPTSGGSGESSFSSHLHMIEDDVVIEGELTFSTCLKVGDEVAMFPTFDGNTYIILCKVVSV